MKINDIIKYYSEGLELPPVLRKALLNLFNVENVSDFSAQDIIKLKEANSMFYYMGVQ